MGRRMNNRPIGIFDSGIGGLTVVKEIFKALPYERIIYLGDTARVPYGTKSDRTIKLFSVENAGFLMRFGVKMIVAACNTASSIALPLMRRRFDVPVIGVIKPGAERAVMTTRNGRIGVIGTPATIKSRAYENEIMRISGDKKVISRACPFFVPLAEEGWLKGKISLDIAERYLGPLCREGIDTLVLGCTHYPLLKGVISRVVGRGVAIVDSAGSAADEIKYILRKTNTLSGLSKRPVHRFFATDAVGQFVKVGERFLGERIRNARKAAL